MVCAVIVAAGKGTRMGPGVDKLFLTIGQLPLVGYTWRRVDSCDCIDQIILVVRDGMQSAFHELAAEIAVKKPYALVIGGQERQDSVWNGVQAAPNGTEVVVIQDAARPCTSTELFRISIEAAREVGAAVAAQRVTDTIKESDGGNLVSKTLDRSKLWAVQTPQTFKLDVIRRALSAVRERNVLVTDDTAACELIGQPVKLVESRWPNPKATSPADLPFIEVILQSQKQNEPLRKA